MAIIGSLIKKGIDLVQLFNIEGGSVQTQETQLKNLLTKAQDTAFGKYYGFRDILRSDNLVRNYQKQVPIHDYSDMSFWWEQQQVFEDITWPGKPGFFALSSGTTGNKSKRIPVTDEMLETFRSVSLAQVAGLSHFDLPNDFFERQILALGSSTDLAPYKDHLEGEISGINASQAPDWFDFYYKPGKEIAQISDWDNRLKAILKAAPDWDIGALAGIPSWVLMMLKAIIKTYDLKTIHDLWPGLKVYTTGGVAFEPFRASFEKLFDQEVFFMDTYLASEGYFAFNARPQTNAMQLALQYGMFFEFIPFDDTGFDETGQLLDDPNVVTIAEVEEDKDYALLVSTPAGAYRYMIGDTIKFTDRERSEILISGRTKYFLNVVGAQLSEDKLNDAIQQLSKSLDIEINEFAVAAVKNENDTYIHQWVIAANTSFDQEKAISILDNALQNLNKNYKVARTKALKGIQVKRVLKSDIYGWLEDQKKKGGQVKVPKVMSEEKMGSLLEFLG